jgi:subtilisin family serine protease
MNEMIAVLFSILLLSSALIGNTQAFLGGDLPQKNSFQVDNLKIEHSSDILSIEPSFGKNENSVKRYLIFGTGSIQDVKKIKNSLINSIDTKNGFYSVGVLSENEVAIFRAAGYNVVADFLLDFHSKENKDDIPDVSKIGSITKSDKVFEKYGYTGAGINIAVVDTGVDFSNPDIMDSLARDKNNHPIMLDADGQGIVLTNTTFIANINEMGILRNTTEPLPKNITSSVYITREGVFLDFNQQKKGTIIQIYNSFFPLFGSEPIFNGTIIDDMKIGENNRDFILSKSGVYRFGIIYQGALEGSLAGVQVVPVLVVDSHTPGLYDTIIPDLSTSWKDFTRFDLKKGVQPDYDFDFTDEKPIVLGSGNEHLVYDFDEDGRNDYSAGTIGAQVLDVYGVINEKKATIDKNLRAVNGTLLPAFDPKGVFFGLMTDAVGHGTSSAASIASSGTVEYDIYNDTNKYKIQGVAPGAKIIPVKALWFGDTVYAWLWAAGFDSVDDKWVFDGKTRADIISNSWGVSNFPSLKMGPGLDILSLILSVLVVPQSLDENYPGVTIVTSAGNSGHGYGTVGLPNASPYGITVGATTNNAFVGYGPFKDQPRFGSTTDLYNNVVDFSSRGPGIIGDPKPDLMSIGAYSFTPSTVSKIKKDPSQNAFSLFGGTSMAAPIVSGSAAVLMESMNENFENYDPLRIKNILMSTATDLYNDPLTQGSGIVNVYDAVQFVSGQDDVFIVYNDASYSNIKKILDVPLGSLNSTLFGIDEFELAIKKQPVTSWFAGRLLPGERSSAVFTIENPTNNTLDITIQPQSISLIKKDIFNEKTAVHLQDSILNETGTYIPNYYRLVDAKTHNDLYSYYDDTYPIPDDTSLTILTVNFPFNEFMNKTDEIYANDLKISSLYLYDWNDKNNDTKIASDEISLVNRGGSWGTVQEIRVSEPNKKFEHTPVVGIYPVPTRHSYWVGDTLKNSTSMDFTLTSNHYKKDKWNVIWLDNQRIQIPPKNSTEITATLVVPIDFQSGVYQGFLRFEGTNHTTNVPVSFTVKELINSKDRTVLITSSQDEDILYRNGFVKGAFDMVNRYMAGDWRQYYFEIADRTINSGIIDISWENEDTSISAFVFDPQGRIVQTNVESGVFGHFMNWPTVDWLGTTPFSQGGGFFPVKNKDLTSSALYTPINQTGTYTLLVHSTLFGGDAPTEPITLAAKFTTILHDDKEPTISLIIPEVINKHVAIMPQIFDENLDEIKYFLNDKEFNFTSNFIESESIEDGTYELKIFASDIVGFNVTKSFTLNVDNTKPTLVIKSPIDDMTVSETLFINFDVKDANLPDKGGIKIILPNGEIRDQTQLKFDTSQLEEGSYKLQILAEDIAGNNIKEQISFNVDHSKISPAPTMDEEPKSQQNNLLIIGIALGLVIGVVSILLATKKIKISVSN